MNDRSRDFSVAQDPWIRVQRPDDGIEEVSIRDALVRAPEFVRIVGDMPTQVFAIARLLLAVLHRVSGGPKDNESWTWMWRSGPPTESIDAYLSDWQDRFWLFDSQAPFFQVAGLESTSGAITGLDRLIADVPPKDPFFTVRLGPYLEQISAAEAARWLVHCQAFDASGIKTGAKGDPRVKGGKGYPIGVAWGGNIGGLLVEGANLWETLLLNLVPEHYPHINRSNADRPAWEAEPPAGPAEAADVGARPYGPMDLYTWQARRIRLFGDREQVTHALVCNGDRLKPQNLQDREPMTAWRRSAPQEKALKISPVYMPQEHHANRALWRGISALLPGISPRSGGSGKDPQPFLTSAVLEWLAQVVPTISEGQAALGFMQVRVHAFGIEYGSQSAVVDGVIDDRVDLDSRLLDPGDPNIANAATAAVASAEEGVRALAFLAANLERAAGAVDRDGGEGARIRAQTEAYRRLGESYSRWLLDLAELGATEGTRAWQVEANRILRSLADQLVSEAGPTAMVGRELQIPNTDRKGHMSAAEAALIFSGQMAKIFPGAHPATKPKEAHV